MSSFIRCSFISFLFSSFFFIRTSLNTLSFFGDPEVEAGPAAGLAAAEAEAGAAVAGDLFGEGEPFAPPAPEPPPPPLWDSYTLAGAMLISLALWGTGCRRAVF